MPRALRLGHWLRPITIPPNLHPAVRKLFALMNEHQIGYADLAARSGVSVGAIESWRSRAMPRLDLLDACLGVFGYTLYVKPAVKKPLDSLPQSTHNKP